VRHAYAHEFAPVPAETATSYDRLSGMAKLVTDQAVEESAQALNGQLRIYKCDGYYPLRW